MKRHRNKMLLIVFALQILLLFSVVAVVYGISGNGQTVIIEMTGYDPYDALRGRYLRLDNPSDKVTLEPDSVIRYENKRGDNKYVYVILKENPDTGLSSFSYASLDRPDNNIPYIKCKSRHFVTQDGETKINIYPRINQYYLNEKHAEQLDRSIGRDTEIRLILKIWHGMYVVDGITVDGQEY